MSLHLTPNDFTPRTKRVLKAAMLASSKMGNGYVGTEHLLIAVISEDDSYAVAFLKEMGVTPDAVARAVSNGLQSGINDSQYSQSDEEYGTSRNNSSLEKYGRDLTKAAKNGEIDPVIGREKEIQRVIQILSRRTKNNPVLIGCWKNCCSRRSCS